MKSVNLLLAVFILLSTSACLLKMDGKTFSVQEMADEDNPGTVDDGTDINIELTEFDICVKGCGEISDKLGLKEADASCSESCAVFKAAGPVISCEDPIIKESCGLADPAKYDAAKKEISLKCDPLPASEIQKCYDESVNWLLAQPFAQKVCIKEELPGVCNVITDDACKTVYKDAYVDEEKCIYLKDLYEDKTIANKNAYAECENNVSLKYKPELEKICQVDPIKCTELSKMMNEAYTICKMTLEANTKELELKIKPDIAYACAVKITDPAKCESLKKDYSIIYEKYKMDYGMKIDACRKPIDMDFGPKFAQFCATAPLDQAKCEQVKNEYSMKHGACKELIDPIKINDCFTKLDIDYKPLMSEACEPRIINPIECAKTRTEYEAKMATCSQIEADLKNAIAGLDAKFGPDIKAACAVLQIESEICEASITPLVKPVLSCVQETQVVCSAVTCSKVTGNVYSAVKEKITAFSADEAARILLESLQKEPVCKLAVEQNYAKQVVADGVFNKSHKKLQYLWKANY